ncbi:MAG: tRNA (guanosine(46)-N7)-methyltransferase TrmB [Rhodospirillaceae bacterium]|nr:tRNA (guanosine(46)-N7)-methyltransferase TrmB [Rhodospirillaceae bacterium]
MNHKQETISRDQRWYGRRHGRKLRPARQQLLDVALPPIRVSLPDGDGAIDLAALFPEKPAALWMEIGFGTGEHLAALAAQYPDIGFIGCEPFVNGVASMLAKIEEQGLTNVRVFDDDVRLLMPHMPDASLQRLYVLFSDPWPKLRHHRRRISVPENLSQFARMMADNGTFLFATDQHDFAAWSLRHMLQEPGFEWTAQCRSDWLTPPSDWQPTRYQLKARKKGLEPVFLRLRRCSRP